MKETVIIFQDLFFKLFDAITFERYQFIIKIFRMLCKNYIISF